MYFMSDARIPTYMFKQKDVESQFSLSNLITNVPSQRRNVFHVRWVQTYIHFETGKMSEVDFL
jgi:hypothetical protein